MPNKLSEQLLSPTKISKRTRVVNFTRTKMKAAKSTRLRRVVILSSALLVLKISSGLRFQAL
jgi:hypothetical protein